MKISAKFDYAMRLLAKLGTQKDQIIQTSEIAAEEKVSLKFLQSILKELKDGGLIETIVGPHGGAKLSRDPYEITFLEIYEVFLEDLRVVEPCKEFVACGHLNSCGFQSILSEGQSRMRDYFKSISLGMLIEKNNQLINS